jgi:hypothetical protein
MPYQPALDAVRRKHGTPLQPGSAAETQALARFREFFSTFSADKVDRLLAATYANDVWFNDTLKEIQGLAQLAPYLRHSAEAVEACTVRIDEIIGNGNGDYFARWSMMIRFKRFARGEDTHSIGISQLRFDRDGLVVFHQDFWNAADGLFQYVPVLGAAIRAIKRRL